MHPLIAITAGGLLLVVLAPFWACWASDGRPVLPAEQESRPVELA